jgi:hypothetical protein
VDFIPYEGAPIKAGNQLNRSIIVAAIVAVMLGAWALAIAPAHGGTPVAETQMAAAGAGVGNLPPGDGNTDCGLGESESELAKHPVAER